LTKRNRKISLPGYLNCKLISCSIKNGTIVEKYRNAIEMIDDLKRYDQQPTGFMKTEQSEESYVGNKIIFSAKNF